MTQFIDTLVGIFQSSGFARFGEPGGYLYAVMICVGCFLLYLAIVKEFEPLILLPMAFGMILANLPGSGVIHTYRLSLRLPWRYHRREAHRGWKHAAPPDGDGYRLSSSRSLRKRPT